MDTNFAEAEVKGGGNRKQGPGFADRRHEKVLLLSERGLGQEAAQQDGLAPSAPSPSAGRPSIGEMACSGQTARPRGGQEAGFYANSFFAEVYPVSAFPFLGIFDGMVSSLARMFRVPHTAPLGALLPSCAQWPGLALSQISGRKQPQAGTALVSESVG